MFITIEGLEGAGKSTVIKYIETWLQQQQVDYIVTREPGGTEIAEHIREVLLNHHTEKMASDTELLLMFASRAQHLTTVIKPALAVNKLVMSDRFTDASYAYQGRGRNIPAERVAILEQFVQGELRPDYVFVLDVTPEIGLKRAKKNGKLDRIESEDIEFFNRVRSYYLDQIADNPERYKVIDASRSLAEVKQQVEVLCSKYILGNKPSGSN